MRRTLAPVVGLCGLALAGEGAFFLLGGGAHEDVLLAAALLLSGLALAWAGDLPSVHAPRAVLGTCGAIALGGVLAYAVHVPNGWAPPEFAIAAVGLGLLVAAAIDRPRLAVAATWALPLLGLPLATWAAQAATKTAFGVTPLEWFTIHALLVPLAVVLAVLGRDPSVAGQTVTYATGTGAMSVEVGVACSGIHAMALFGGILVAWALAHKPPPRRLAAWTAIGLGGLYVANLARLVGLTLIGGEWGAAALESAHAQAGWILFVAWSGAFAWLATRRAGPAAAASAA